MSSENVSTESLNDHICEEIPEEVHAVDDGLDDEDRLELQKGNVDMSLIQELEEAKEEYKQRTHKFDIVEPTTLHTEVVKISCNDLLLNLTEFTKQAQLDTDTFLREQINDPVLQTVRQWLKAGKVQPSTSTIRHCKGLCAYKKYLTYYYSRNKMTYFITINQTRMVYTIQKYVFHFHYF